MERSAGNGFETISDISLCPCFCLHAPVSLCLSELMLVTHGVLLTQGAQLPVHPFQVRFSSWDGALRWHQIHTGIHWRHLFLLWYHLIKIKIIRLHLFHVTEREKEKNEAPTALKSFLEEWSQRTQPSTASLPWCCSHSSVLMWLSFCPCSEWGAWKPGRNKRVGISTLQTALCFVFPSSLHLFGLWSWPLLNWDKAGRIIRKH